MMTHEPSLQTDGASVAALSVDSYGERIGWNIESILEDPPWTARVP